MDSKIIMDLHPIEDQSSRLPTELEELLIQEPSQYLEDSSVNTSLDPTLKASSMGIPIQEEHQAEASQVTPGLPLIVQDESQTSLLSNAEPGNTYNGISWEDENTQDLTDLSLELSAEYQYFNEYALLDHHANPDPNNENTRYSKESLEDIGLLLLSNPSPAQISNALLGLQAIQRFLEANATAESFESQLDIGQGMALESVDMRYALSTFSTDQGDQPRLENAQSVTLRGLNVTNAPSSFSTDDQEDLEAPAVPNNPEACFLGVPEEIRNLFYDYLLVNPVLGTHLSVSKFSGCGADVPYDLSPQLLRVCKQVHREGTDVLYNLNNFFAFCSESYKDHAQYRCYLWSPLNRFPLEDFEGVEVQLHERPAFSLVKRWDVLINTHFRQRNRLEVCQWAFRDLCRALFKSNAEQINLRLIPKMLQKGSDRSRYLDFDALMHSASLLRVPQANGKFTLAEADFWQVGGDDLIEPDENFNKLYSATEDWYPLAESELFSLVTSSSPAEAAFKMYSKVLKYAQSFEQFVPFRLEMAFELSDEHTETTKVLFPDFFESGRNNPFRGEEVMHPIEAHLVPVKASMEVENTTMFKIHRAAILNYLEPQYQAIHGAAVRIHKFVMAQKVNGGFLDIGYDAFYLRNGNDRENLAAEFVLLIETFSASFAREISFDISLKIRPWKKTFLSLYANLPVFATVNKVTNFYEERNIEALVSTSIKAITGLLELFFEMRAARRGLFSEDLADIRGWEINIEDDEDLQEIDWAHNGLSKAGSSQDSDSRSVRTNSLDGSDRAEGEDQDDSDEKYGEDPDDLYQD